MESNRDRIDAIRKNLDFPVVFVGKGSFYYDDDMKYRLERLEDWNNWKDAEHPEGIFDDDAFLYACGIPIFIDR